MSHPLVLGTLLLSLVSSEADQSAIVAQTQEKNFSVKKFCKKALRTASPMAAVISTSHPITVAEFCKAYIPYATHSESSRGYSYIKYSGKNRWLTPTAFCAQETTNNCDKLIIIKYNSKVANPNKPTKSLGDYCKDHGKDLGCINSNSS